MANNIKEAGNAMRRELGKLCEMQIADGMWASARKSDAACTAWDKALSELSQCERVFTESEVRAMLRSITHCTGSPLASIHIEEVRRVFADEHGIVLDPA